MSSPLLVETSGLDDAKRWVVRLVQDLSRGLAVDFLWWETSSAGPTLSVEGRLREGVAGRITHTFDPELLHGCADGRTEHRERVRVEMARLLRGFGRRRPALPT